MKPLSRALQALAPVACGVVDARHGRAVPLTTAGYVLRPGRSYRVQIRWPFPDDDLDRVFLAAPPEFVRADPATRGFDDQGRAVYSIPFGVQKGGKSRWEWLLVNSDELHVDCAFRPGVRRETEPFKLPVVVRPYRAILVVMILVSLATAVAPAVVQRFVRQAPVEGGFGQFATDLLTNPLTGGLFLAVLVGSGLLIGLVHFAQTVRRSRELRARFVRDYNWSGL